MPAGIGGLATGFLQGLSIKRQNDRQNAQDEMQQERFDMEKQRFATQQEQDAFNFQNAQTEAGRRTKEYTRAEKLQGEQDSFRDKIKDYYAKQQNGEFGNFYTNLEKDNQSIGLKGQFLRDETGNIKIDAKGNAAWQGGKAGEYIALTPQQALTGYFKTFNAPDSVKSQIEAELKEQQQKSELEKQITLKGIDLKNSKELAILNASLRPKDPKDPKLDEVLPPHLLKMFETTEEVINPISKEVKTYRKFNQEGIDQFSAWTTANNVPATTSSYQKWRASLSSLNGVPTPITAPKPSNAEQPIPKAKKEDVLSLIRKQNITDEAQAAEVIRKLKTQGYTEYQINQAFKELGLAE
jgi:hypothetical protein